MKGPIGLENGYLLAMCSDMDLDVIRLEHPTKVGTIPRLLGMDS